MEKRGMWEEKEGQEKKRRTEFFTRKHFFFPLEYVEICKYNFELKVENDNLSQQSNYLHCVRNPASRKQMNS